MTRGHVVTLALAAGTACAGAAGSTSSASPGSDRPAVTLQPRCTTPDDSTGVSISGTFASRPEPLYAAGSATLRALGYAVLEHAPPRELVTAPSYVWPAGTETEGWHGTEHPGIEN